MRLREIFSTNLRRFRKERGLTQQKFAEFCNISTNYVGDIEKQKKFPSVELIERMTEVLGIQAGDLFHSGNCGENSEANKNMEFKFREAEKGRLCADLTAAIQKVLKKY